MFCNNQMASHESIHQYTYLEPKLAILNVLASSVILAKHYLLPHCQDSLWHWESTIHCHYHYLLSISYFLTFITSNNLSFYIPQTAQTLLIIGVPLFRLPLQMYGIHCQMSVSSVGHTSIQGRICSTRYLCSCWCIKCCYTQLCLPWIPRNPSLGFP